MQRGAYRLRCFPTGTAAAGVDDVCIGDGGGDGIGDVGGDGIGDGGGDGIGDGGGDGIGDGGGDGMGDGGGVAMLLATLSCLWLFCQALAPFVLVCFASAMHFAMYSSLDVGNAEFGVDALLAVRFVERGLACAAFVILVSIGCVVLLAMLYISVASVSSVV